MQLRHNNNFPFCGVLLCGKVWKQIILTSLVVALLKKNFLFVVAFPVHFFP